MISEGTLSTAMSGRVTRPDRRAASPEVVIRVATELRVTEIAALADLLVVVVDGGASLGFLAPLSRGEAMRYWSAAPAPDVVLLLAEVAGRIIGTAQLQPAESANGQHRGDVAKVMVHPDWQRQGIGRRLMVRVEAAARATGRWLLVLDTRDGDPANRLYRSLGYQEVGRIPGYSRTADGRFAATLFYYKALS